MNTAWFNRNKAQFFDKEYQFMVQEIADARYPEYRKIVLVPDTIPEHTSPLEAGRMAMELLNSMKARKINDNDPKL